MKRIFLLIVITALLVHIKAYTQEVNTKNNTQTRPRVLVISDFPPLDVISGEVAKPGDPPYKLADPDDVQSMVRFLLYSNELEVEGLVAAAGTFANIARKQNILDMLDLYEKVQPNLVKHDARYPTAEKLRSITWQDMDGSVGTVDFAGAKYRPIESLIGQDFDTEASEAIIRVVDKPDPRPVWVCVWGGPRAVAQAIWKVKNTRKPDEVERFLNKLRIYLILKQDYTGDWLVNNFPKLFVILSEKNYTGMFCDMQGSETKLVDANWVNEHIRTRHGLLGAAYPRNGWNINSPGVWEGDTPSYLNLISGLRGVNDPEKPNQAGWGGKFIQPDPAKNHWFDDPMGPKAVYMWREYFQPEFAQRANWMMP